MAEPVLPTSYPHRHAAELAGLLTEVTTLRADLLALAQGAADQRRAVHPNFRLSARNLRASGSVGQSRLSGYR